MAEPGGQDYLSIGEVLGILLEEFPDVTISKIRFLESQGLIDPERTPSGYRKFYDADVELLRVILREQRENYLPLRVIKDRIETGIIDPSGELPKPAGPDQQPSSDETLADDEADTTPATGVEVPAISISHHPAAQRDTGAHRPTASATSHTTSSETPDAPTAPAAPVETTPVETTPAVTAGPDGDGSDRPVTAPRLLPGVLVDRAELCTIVGLTGAQLDELERYGVVHGRGSGGGTLYGDDAVEIASVAVEMLRAGLDARHLRAFRTSAEREVSMYEQLVTPRLRQRNPAARAEALDHLRTLDELGGRLRSALTRTALRHHFDA